MGKINFSQGWRETVRTIASIVFLITVACSILWFVFGLDRKSDHNMKKINSLNAQIENTRKNISQLSMDVHYLCIKNNVNVCAIYKIGIRNNYSPEEIKGVIDEVIVNSYSLAVEKLETIGASPNEVETILFYNGSDQQKHLIINKEPNDSSM